MQIKLFKGLYIDIPKLIASKLFIFANSGFGKSWLLRWFLEQTFGKVQQIIIDPEGEFSTLREKFDYILIGKGKDFDIQADPKTAALLAHRLLQEGVSAIIDLYELDPGDGHNPGERDKFVANFSRALVNAPKDLWHPYIYVVDEAQDFAPEKGNTLSHGPLLALAKKGRKRGCCTVFATQRVADFSKSVIATCNNKMIGQASLDIDMKRCAAELGFTTREEMLSLRDIDPGEFFVFGPAISKTVEKVKIGSVQTSHPDSSKIGGKIGIKVAPASDKVKKALAKLADLPQEAEQEAKTMSDLKSQVITLQRQLQTRPEPVKAVATKIERIEVPMIGKKAIAQFEKSEKSIRKSVAKIQEVHEGAQAVLKALDILAADLKKVQSSKALVLPPAKAYEVHARPPAIQEPVRSPLSDTQQGSTGLTGPEQRILDAAAWLESIGVSEPEQAAVAFLAGYTVGGGGFNNPKGSLRTKGLIEYVAGNKITLTQEGFAHANVPAKPLTTQELHDKVFSVLDGPQQRILRPLLELYPGPIENNALAELAGYSAGGGGFNNPKGRLRSLGLIEYLPGNMIRARDILFV